MCDHALPALVLIILCMVDAQILNSMRALHLLLQLAGWLPACLLLMLLFVLLLFTVEGHTIGDALLCKPAHGSGSNSARGQHAF